MLGSRAGGQRRMAMARRSRHGRGWHVRPLVVRRRPFALIAILAALPVLLALPAVLLLAPGLTPARAAHTAQAAHAARLSSCGQGGAVVDDGPASPTAHVRLNRSSGAAGTLIEASGTGWP